MDYPAKRKLNVCCLFSDPDLFPLKANVQRTHGGLGGGTGHDTHVTMKQRQVLTAIKVGQTKYCGSSKKKESSFSLEVEGRGRWED